MRRRRTNRIKPLLNMKCEWDGQSKYPAKIRIAMQDGNFADYLLDAKQPEPIFLDGSGMVVGYKFRGK